MQNVAVEIIGKVDSNLHHFLVSGYNNLVHTLQPTLTLLLVLFFVIYGFVLLRGSIEMPLRTAVQHVALALFVYVLITGSGYGAQFFKNVFIQGPESVAASVVDAESGSQTKQNLAQTVGKAFKKGYDAGSRIMQNGGWTNWGPYFTGIGVMLVVILFGAYALFLIILAKFALTILLLLTPVFLPLILFSQTRGIFEGWLRQVVNFSIVPILAYSILALMLNMILQYANDTAAEGTIGAALPLVAATFVGLLLLYQVLGIAGGIAGGMSLSSMGALGNAAGSIGRGGKTAGRRGGPVAAAAGRGAGRGASRAGSAAGRGIKAGYQRFRRN